MNDTPGPWFAHDFSGVNGEKVTPCDFAVSCTTPDHLTVAIMGMGATGKREEWEANTKLIAAAPDLLEALEYALAVSDEKLLLGDQWREQARSTIKKARGKA